LYNSSSDSESMMLQAFDGCSVRMLVDLYYSNDLELECTL